MIQFDKLDMQEVQELQNIISKNVEKSELERSYLYTHDTLEKAKIYVWCFRFLYSIRNLTKDGNLKEILAIELKNNSDSYVDVCDLLHKVEKGFFNRHTNLNKLRKKLLMDDNIDDMIDAFAVLLEKSSILSMSRLKGIVIEGQSGKEFKKIFDTRVDENKTDQDVAQPEPEMPEVDNLEMEEKPDNSDGFDMVEDKKPEVIDEYAPQEIPEPYFDQPVMPEPGIVENVGYTGADIQLAEQEQSIEDMQESVREFVNEQRGEPSFDIRNHIGEGIMDIEIPGYEPKEFEDEQEKTSEDEEDQEI